MIGSSVVPGLPNRCVMPSSFSKARNAERPVMRFMKGLLLPAVFPPGSDHHGRSAAARSMEGAHGCPALAGIQTPLAGYFRSIHPLMLDRLFLLRALPDHAGKAFQRHQRLAGIGPVLQLLDRDVIERLPAGTAREQRARDVHHVRRARAFIEQRRAAAGAEAADGLGGLVLV